MVSYFAYRASLRAGVVAGAVAIALAFAPASAMGARNGIVEAVKRVVPGIGQHLVKGAKLTAVCVAAICSFVVLQQAVDALAEQENAVAVAVNVTAPSESGINTKWYLSKGVYSDSFDDFAAIDIGVRSKGVVNLFGLPNIRSTGEFFFLTSLLFKPENIDTLDAANVMPVTYITSKVLVANRGAGKLSYGVSDLSVVALMSNLWPTHARHHALRYQSGSWGFSMLGHEYFDNLMRVVETDDPVRGHYVSLYRGGFNHYHPASKDVLLNIKATSALGLGKLGDLEFGEIGQDRLSAIAGDEAEFYHKLYHEANANVTAIIKQGRLVFSAGAQHSTTIGGEIEAGDVDIGDFTISNYHLTFYGKAVLSQELGIALEAYYAKHWQDNLAKLGGVDIEHNSTGYIGTLAISKTFE